VLQFILDRHLPNAALVLDRHFNCLMGNRASGPLLAHLVEPALMTKGANIAARDLSSGGVRRGIVNWTEVGPYFLDRAERDFGRTAADPVGAQLLAELRCLRRTAGRADGAAAQLGPTEVLLPIHIRRADLELRLFTTIMTFGTPRTSRCRSLRLETFFPADEASEQRWSADCCTSDPLSAHVAVAPSGSASLRR